MQGSSRAAPGDAARAPRDVGHPAFLIVGTPRSGTTLVQRLASELEGVRVPPETHFFTDFVTEVLKRWRLPLSGAALREVLDAYAGRHYLRDIPFDADAVTADLDGRCGSLVELYGAIVRHLAGPARIVGEKTPGHLLWWRPLTRALPELKLVAVVRDPRAVADSWVRLGWGDDPLRAAHRWSSDTRRVLAASKALGPERFLLVRYELLVADPDAVQTRVAEFLGSPGRPVAPAGRARLDASLVPGWETWKHEALNAVDPAQADRWRETLAVAQSNDVRALCRTGMVGLGYGDVLGLAAATGRRLVYPPSAQLRRLRLSARRPWRELEVARIGRSTAFSR